MVIHIKPKLESEKLLSNKKRRKYRGNELINRREPKKKKKLYKTDPILLLLWSKFEYGPH